MSNSIGIRYDRKKIVSLIKKSLEEGYKQTKLADEIGISQGTIYHLLFTNRDHDQETYEKIRTFYGLPLKDVIENPDILLNQESMHLSEEETKLLNLTRSDSNISEICEILSNMTEKQRTHAKNLFKSILNLKPNHHQANGHI